MFRAVDQVSFSVPRGGCLAVVGESGCGKSTIAKALVRLVKPTAGSMVFDGTDIATVSERDLRPMRHRIQMVFQDPYGSLDPHLTAPADRGRAHAGARRTLRDGAHEAVGRAARPGRAADRRAASASRTSSPAVSASGSASPAPWPPSPTCWSCDEATSALDVSVQAQVLDMLAQDCRPTPA